MKILHFLSENSRSRAEGLIWPLCLRASKKVEYHSVFLSPAQPLIRGKNNRWIKKARKLDKDSLLELSKVLKEVNPDIVHIHGVDLVPVIMAAQPKVRAKRVLSAFQQRSSNWFKKTIQSFVGQSIRWVDVVCFSLRQLEDSYVESGLPEGKARFVMDGTRIPKVGEIHSTAICDRPYFLVYPNGSSLRRKPFWKNLVRACEKADVRLLIFPEDAKKLKSHKLHFPKVMKEIDPGLDFRVIVKNAHGVLVLNDNKFPELDILECIHFGTPIVTISTSTVSEMVLHGMNGYICGPSSFEDWKAAIFTLASDYSTRERMRKMSKQYAQQQLTVARWERDMNQVYMSLLDRKAGT